MYHYMEKRFYVYAYSVAGNIVYIGKGTGQRYRDHFWQCYNKETYWARALRKMLSLKVKVDCFIMQSGLTSQEAHDRETELIKYYGKRSDGTGQLYNLSDGGVGPIGFKFSPEQKEKMRERMRGNLYRFGIPHTEEVKQQISASIKGRIETEETRQKKSQSLAWQIEEQIKFAKDLVKGTWWGPHCTVTYDGKVRRQSKTQTHRLFTVTLDGVSVDRTITDFRQGSCPKQFNQFKGKYT